MCCRDESSWLCYDELNSDIKFAENSLSRFKLWYTPMQNPDEIDRKRIYWLYTSQYRGSSLYGDIESICCFIHSASILMAHLYYYIIASMAKIRVDTMCLLKHESSASGSSLPQLCSPRRSSQCQWITPKEMRIKCRPHFVAICIYFETLNKFKNNAHLILIFLVNIFKSTIFGV